jgi:hypothetical protein
LSAYSPFKKCYKILWSGVFSPTRYWFDSLACSKHQRGLLLAFNFYHICFFETSRLITLPTCFHVPVFPSLLSRNNILTRVLDSVRVGDALADVVSWLNIMEPVQQPYPVPHNLPLPISAAELHGPRRTTMKIASKAC